MWITIHSIPQLFFTLFLFFSTTFRYLCILYNHHYFELYSDFAGIAFLLSLFCRLHITEKIKTVDDVKNYISQTEKDIESVTNLRQKYRNKQRNCTDENLIKEYKAKRDECTTKRNKYRKNLKIANYILEDTPKVKEVIKIETQMKKAQEDITKTKKKDRNLNR